jgi:hypothetical protein
MGKHHQVRASRFAHAHPEQRKQLECTALHALAYAIRPQADIYVTWKGFVVACAMSEVWLAAGGEKYLAGPNAVACSMHNIYSRCIIQNVLCAVEKDGEISV